MNRDFSMQIVHPLRCFSLAVKRDPEYLTDYWVICQRSIRVCWMGGHGWLKVFAFKTAFKEHTKHWLFVVFLPRGRHLVSRKKKKEEVWEGEEAREISKVHISDQSLLLSEGKGNRNRPCSCLCCWSFLPWWSVFIGSKLRQGSAEGGVKMDKSTRDAFQWSDHKVNITQIAEGRKKKGAAPCSHCSARKWRCYAKGQVLNGK